MKRRTQKKKANKKRRFTRKDYKSKDGMLTSVWGPGLWHFLHVISFNYPIEPNEDQKQQYHDFMKLCHVIKPHPATGGPPDQ